MNFEDFCPVGECVVCGEQLDFNEAGFCELCKQPFCWGECGGWNFGKHMCNNCQEIEGYE